MFDIPTLIAAIIAFLVAITIHECAHAIVANWLGDPTAKFEGRISLNPLRHLDPMGTILLFLVRFGWGKPVPVNPQNLRSPLRDQALISLAGPVSNLLLAMLLVMLIKYGLVPTGGILSTIFFFTISLNIALMVFNLLPIPPLDGSKVLFLFLGQKYAYISDWLEDNGPLVLFGLIIVSNFFGLPILQTFITRAVDFVLAALYL
ncbi:MAG: site-2 protease family protein [Candidatus Abawacabacteria bacterium]|nr:site-2 protease family protein [Candidatus Abawacabacteria bacterium]